MKELYIMPDGPDLLIRIALREIYLFRASQIFFPVVQRYANAQTKCFGNMAMVAYPKTQNYHLGHVAAFITAYQRISVIEQLNEINPSNILRVCVDGIYFYGDYPVMKNVFRPKTDRAFGNIASDSYVSMAKRQALLKTGVCISNTPAGVVKNRCY